MTTIGWREWLALPELADTPVKAKVDTGAKTSALHAFYIEPYTRDGQLWVKFLVHPLQKDVSAQVECHARVADRRMVSDSGGHKENRYVILTSVEMGGERFTTELTLTDRDSMQFRMLLGRQALKKRFIVDSSTSYRLGGNTRRPPGSLIRS